jgi:transposase
LERIRRRAVALVIGGLTVTDAAKAVGRSRCRVSEWVAAWRAGGDQALAAKPAPGAASKLTDRQKHDLLTRLAKPATSAGFDTPLWTSPRIATLIQRHYKVTYHVNYIPELLRSLGWSPQKVTRRAAERDEPAIERWCSRDWPRIKKTRPGKART